MSRRQQAAPTHFCVGKSIARRGKIVAEGSGENAKAEEFKSIRLAKHYMRTGKRSKK